MATKTPNAVVRDIIIQIQTKLKDKEHDRTKAALHQIQREFGSINNFMKVGNSLGKKYAITETQKARLLRAQAKEANKLKSIAQARLILSRQRGLLLGKNLSMMFMSMQIARSLKQTFRSILKTYQGITQGQTLFSNAINKTTAAVEFLKFSLINAFASSKLGQGLLNIIGAIIDKFSKFVTIHPSLAIGLVIGGVAVLGLAELIKWGAQLALLYDTLRGLAALKTGKLDLSIGDVLISTKKDIISSIRD